MSITTYAELVSALDGANGYLHRTDLTAKIPDFIKIAESRINRKLRVLLQETESTLTATIGSRLMAAPSLFGTPIALWLETYPPREELIYRTPDDLPVDTGNGGSDYYTVDGSNIATENPADIEYSYTLRYWTKFDIATSLTNTVLTNYPDIYIYGTLVASTAWTQDMTQLQFWAQQRDEAMAEAMADTRKTKGKATLRTEFGGDRANILRGF
jgi:hypothetical protein